MSFAREDASCRELAFARRFSNYSLNGFVLTPTWRVGNSSRSSEGAPVAEFPYFPLNAKRPATVESPPLEIHSLSYAFRFMNRAVRVARGDEKRQERKRSRIKAMSTSRGKRKLVVRKL